jgi:hypothetical protein
MIYRYANQDDIDDVVLFLSHDATEEYPSY